MEQSTGFKSYINKTHVNPSCPSVLAKKYAVGSDITKLNFIRCLFSKPALPDLDNNGTLFRNICYTIELQFRFYHFELNATK